MIDDNFGQLKKKKRHISYRESSLRMKKFTEFVDDDDDDALLKVLLEPEMLSRICSRS